MKNIELRMNDFNILENTSEGLVVSGYVNETGKQSHLLGQRKKFREVIKKGAFARALSKGNDIHFLAEHDANKILASTRNNSLKLVEDDKGLLMTAEISDTSYGRDYHTLIKDGILRNMSFGFSVDKDKWRKLNDGTYTRDISDLTLYEVSVVTNPAYPQSSISARGLNLVEEVDIPENVEMEETDVEEKQVQDVQVEETVEQKEEVVKQVKEEPTTEVVEEVVEEKQPEQEESKEVEEVVEEEKQLEQEERAYVDGVWSDRDILNTALEIIGNVSTLLQYNKKAETKVLDAKTEKSFNDIVANCSNIITSLNETKVEEVATPVATVERNDEKEVPEEVRKLQERFSKI